MADFTILSVSETGTLDDLLRPLRIKIVSYRVGTHGPFQLSIPASEFSADKVRQLISEQVQKFRELGLV